MQHTFSVTVVTLLIASYNTAIAQLHVVALAFESITCKYTPGQYACIYTWLAAKDGSITFFLPFSS